MRFPSDLMRLGALFAKQGHEIRVVGGWVRDVMRGLRSDDLDVLPHDLDLCTNALPEQMIALCRANDFAFLDAGLKHGTIGIILNSVVYEITTLRVDVETDGRHAEVEFTTDWRADAARRDFTINAMSIDLQGRLFDYFDGYRDCVYKRVTFVGDPAHRIREDYLRILRYFRFKGVLDDDLDTIYIERAIRENADGLSGISVERIWMEMSRILAGGNLFNVLSSMWVTATLPAIGIEECGLGDIQRAVDARALTDDPIVIMAALTNTPMADRWKLSKSETSLLRWLQVDRHTKKPFDHELRAICTTKGLGHAYACARAAMYGDRTVYEAIRDWQVPEFPVQGSDLIAVGYAPGEALGAALRRLHQHWQQTDYALDKHTLLSVLVQ
jgi:tRNA nucleotidyltransferase (CCA-adding enzyme)